jgi:hypothetical protein
LVLAADLSGLTPIARCLPTADVVRQLDLRIFKIF